MNHRAPPIVTEYSRLPRSRDEFGAPHFATHHRGRPARLGRALRIADNLYFVGTEGMDALMVFRRGCTRLVLTVTVVVGSAAIESCAAVSRALKMQEAPTSRAESANACSQQESAARAAAIDALNAASPATSPEAAMAASMAQSRAAIAENEYRNCLVSH